ncbi:hypothetical protein B0T14DRAFT_565078 [Immersiella caudata]|uniref:Uncharacterized protein n=1 Tax=Immersiella caudata TaxID=314043 RepID=A0AA39WY29_9PEZI|nr:hypothetical protein B0T14DRAFT_565078 [Immersiella caudata]
MKPARLTLFAFLAAALSPELSWAASNNGMELDIISPVAGGRHHVNPITKIPAVIADSDLFIAIATADRLGFSTTSGALPPGNYLFEWEFSVGPWCGSAPGAEKTTIWRNSGTISNWSFHITIDDDAPWPEFDSKSCPSVAGQAAATAEYA